MYYPWASFDVWKKRKNYNIIWSATYTICDLWHSPVIKIIYLSEFSWASKCPQRRRTVRMRRCFIQLLIFRREFINKSRKTLKKILTAPTKNYWPQVSLTWRWLFLFLNVDCFIFILTSYKVGTYLPVLFSVQFCRILLSLGNWILRKNWKYKTQESVILSDFIF